MAISTYSTFFVNDYLPILIHCFTVTSKHANCSRGVLIASASGHLGGRGRPKGGARDNTTLEGVAFEIMLYLLVKEGVKGEKERERREGGEKKECN